MAQNQKLVTTSDIGVFSGKGITIENLVVIDSLCLSFDITKNGTLGDLLYSTTIDTNANLFLELMSAADQKETYSVLEIY